MNYCVKKYLRALHDPKYDHWPQFAEVEEHGPGKSVKLTWISHILGLVTEEISYDLFREVWEID